MKVVRNNFLVRKQEQGFVLILVLGIVILITLLVVGFLGHALSQTKSVTSYRAQTDSLLLGDVAVNLVKAQIDDATSQANSIWASQPGAIRTFTNGGTEPNPTTGTVYKLYSSSSLTSTNPPTDIPNDLPGTPDSNDWNSNPLWTDLNAPVLKSDNTYAYPIIDAYNDPAVLPGVSLTGANAVPSFSITANNVGATTPLSKTTPSTIYPVPMPVRWLYVLKQGQIVAPDTTSSSTTATFNSASPLPTVANPIVGRIAYWTDDDTCRVNINTASVSGTSAAVSASAIDTFWDTPRFTASDDYLLGLYQPANNEYQRYPGHPAMTTLALALPEFADTSGNVTVTNLKNVLTLTPRYGNGGSAGGTVLSNTSPTVTLNTNRLYASVSELLFNPPGVASPRTSTSLTRPQLETAKFFLTAHSRAPELNLSGMPRIAIWPVSSINDSNHRTATDQLIAFCSSTIGSGGTGASRNNYYFTRHPFTASPSGTGSNSTIGDISLPSDPANNLFSNSNINLLSYLDDLTALPVPGNVSSGVTYDSKYTQLGMRQILTEIFDYIRITNSRDPGLDPASGGPAGGVPYAAATAWDNNDANPGSSNGQILPTQNNMPGWAGTYGFGRFQGRIVEASVIFIGVGQGPAVSTPQTYTTYTAVPTNEASIGSGVFYSSLPPASNANPNNPCVAVPPAPVNFIPPPGQTAVMALFVLNFFDPALGYARTSSYVAPLTSGLTNIQVTPSGNATQQLFVRDGGERLSTQTGVITGYSQYAGANPGSLGSLMDFRIMLGGRTLGSSNTQYPTYSDIINMPTGGSFIFNPTSASFTVYICANGAPVVGGTATIPQVHAYTFNFPKATLSVPGLSARPLFGSITGRATSLQSTGSDTTDRFDDVRTTNNDSIGYYAHLIDFAHDTVISMVPSAAYGDYRMLCAPTTPASAFTSLYNYTASPPPASQATPPITLGASGFPSLAYGFMYPSGQTFTNALHGSLVSGASYYMPSAPANPASYGSQPLVPWTVQNPTAGASTAPPDFDNGFGELPDGPYINKPDEGAVYSNTAGRVYYDNADSFVDTTIQPSFFFSPQRQVPSPVMFGSLPTGAPVNGSTPKPWQTLLFQPGAATHPGLTAPKDEYLLDLFWMPQAQPYAISEPFSTAGKVNLNYQILPFTYIDRSTAIQSVLASEKVAQVAASHASTYKKDVVGNTTGMGVARLPLNLSETTGTLGWFIAKFNAWTVFKAAAEICDVYLVPQGQSWTPSTAQAQWYGTNYALVGDNTREKPYADIYSRITTKSNVYTVFYRVQTLKNSAAAPATWTEGTGIITGEFRGSTTLERYIDPNNTSIPDYGSLSASAMSSTPSLDSPTYYKWRVVENNRFAP
jgi:uncharacterized protein (TIGR02600 family)